MRDTLGTLLDALITVHLKRDHTAEAVAGIDPDLAAKIIELIDIVNATYHEQETVYTGKYKEMDREQLVAYITKIGGLNLQRNMLIDEIDQLVQDIVDGKRTQMTFKSFKVTR